MHDKNNIFNKINVMEGCNAKTLPPGQKLT